MKKPAHPVFLSEKFFVILLAVQCIGILSLSVPACLVVYLVLGAWLIVFAAWDKASLPRKVKDGVQGRILWERTPEIGARFRVELELTIDSFVQRGGRLPHRLFWSPPSLRALVFSSQLVPVEVEEISGSKLRFHSTVDADARALGYERIGEVSLVADSRRGLWGRRLTARIQPAALRVIPSRRGISEQAFRELTHNQRLFYQGTRQSLRGRTTDQFHSVRKYHFPDPLKNIDARKTAKFGRFMTRVYDTFLSHHLILALDLGRGMTGRLGTSFKRDYYLSACLALAQNAQRSQDRVSFIGFSDEVHHLIRPTREMAPFLPLFEGSADCAVRDRESNFECLVPTIQSLSGQRSLVLVLTDLMKPSTQASVLASLPSMCDRHLVVLVGLLDENYALESELERSDASALTLEHYNHLLYTYWLDEKTTLFKARAARMGAGVLLATPQDWLSVVVRLYALLRESPNL